MGTKPFRWTVHETPAFVNSAAKIWHPAEREEIVDQLATYAPEGDDRIPGSNGCFKSRKAIGDAGKSSGARIIYWIDEANQRIFLLIAYTKANKSTIPGAKLLPIVDKLKKYTKKKVQ